jgi:hypothetical protein
VSEQEPVVDNNLQQIDELVAQHGQDVAQELEPLKLEMLAAKEGGFKETQVAKDPNFTESGPL